MSYLDDESSQSGAKPVELYRFDGTYASWYYTSGPKLVSYDAGDGTGPHDYIPITIERTDVKGGTQDDDGLDITVTMPVTEQLVQEYGFTTSPPKLKLTIYRQEPTGTITYWIGPVNNFNIDESGSGRASLKCPSVLGAALIGNIPDVYYQTPCNHTLYDPRCGVDYGANSEVTTVSLISADEKQITVASIGALDGKLIGGELALGTGEVRMITAQVGNVLTINFPFSNISLGGAATIAAGCDYAYTGDCKLKFNNQGRFGGFVFIPPINPFMDGIQPAEAGVTDDACVYSPPTYWAMVQVKTDFGPNVPILAPWSFQFVWSRGGVEQAHLYNSGGGSGTAGFYDGGGGANGDGTYDYLHGWTMYIDLAHNATDPFAAGPPDKLHVDMQWPYSNYIFPGDSTFGGDHGDLQITLIHPSFTLSSPIYSGIFGLWPASYDFPL